MSCFLNPSLHNGCMFKLNQKLEQVIFRKQVKISLSEEILKQNVSNDRSNWLTVIMILSLLYLS